MTSKILLDSSFFFPFINVQVKNYSSDIVLKMINDPRWEIIRSDLVIFELSAKGSKLVKNKVISLQILINGINSLQYLGSVKSIPIFYSEIQRWAVKFLHNHTDFIDCLTLATAINYASKFITLDKELKKKYDLIWKNDILEVNRDFILQLAQDFFTEAGYEDEDEDE